MSPGPSVEIPARDPDPSGPLGMLGGWSWAALALMRAAVSENHATHSHDNFPKVFLKELEMFCSFLAWRPRRQCTVAMS